jgi:hypothetical protein
MCAGAARAGKDGMWQQLVLCQDKNLGPVSQIVTTDGCSVSDRTFRVRAVREVSLAPHCSAAGRAHPEDLQLGEEGAGGVLDRDHPVLRDARASGRSKRRKLARARRVQGVRRMADGRPSARGASINVSSYV